MSITPDKIFSNEIPILNVNVINPPEPVKDDKGNTQESIVYTLQQTVSTWYVVFKKYCNCSYVINTSICWHKNSYF